LRKYASSGGVEFFFISLHIFKLAAMMPFHEKDAASTYAAALTVPGL